MRAPGPTRRVMIVSVLLGLLLAPAACAGPERRGEVTSVVAGDGDTVLVTVVDGSGQSFWSVSPDGSLVGRVERPPAGDAAAQACVGDTCYRTVAGRLAVERSTDGGRSYDVDWEVSGAAYEGLAADYPDLGDPAVHLSSVAVAMRPAPDAATPTAARGPVVFVANGRDGLLYRNAAGRWMRLGVPQGTQPEHFAGPPPVRPGAGIAGQVALAAGSIVLLAAGMTIARRRTVRPVRAAVAAGIAAVIAAAGYFASGLPDLGAVPAVIYATFIVVTVTIGGTAMAIAVLTSPEQRTTGPAKPTR
jgi:hypothetical protein